MILPGIFAELELLRHVGLVEASIVDIETKIFKLDFEASGIEAMDRKTMNKRNIGKREAWLDASYLRNSLVTWNVQIAKMARHAEEFSLRLNSPPCRPEITANRPKTKESKQIFNESQYETGHMSTDSSQTLAAVDESDKEEWVMAEEDIKKPTHTDSMISKPTTSAIRNDRTDVAGKIKDRLDTIHDEYKEKIRDCSMRIDGMAMATQWVCSAKTHNRAQS
jgi:hypothetical protein